jgi:hypothetical protein
VSRLVSVFPKLFEQLMRLLGKEENGSGLP